VAEPKKTTEPKKVSSDATAALAGESTENIFATPSGLLNSIDSPIVRKFRLDSHNFDGLGAIRAMFGGFFSEDLLTGLGSLNGIVLRLETDVKESGVSSFFLDLLGLSDEKPLVRCKVRIPEIHKMIPFPGGMGDPGYPASKNDNDYIIDMFPTFDAESTDVSFDTIKVGDIINVQYSNKNNWSSTARPLITSVVKSPPPPIGAAGRDACINGYNSAPPQGDNIAGAPSPSSHTGVSAPEKRARNKRTSCQIFMDPETHGIADGYVLADELVTAFKSRGYAVLGTKTAVPGIPVHSNNNVIKPSSNAATLEGLIKALPKAIQKGVHAVVIQFNAVTSTGLLMPREKNATVGKDIRDRLIRTIDEAAGGAPNIYFIGPWNSPTPTGYFPWNEVFDFGGYTAFEGKKRIHSFRPLTYWGTLGGKILATDPSASRVNHMKTLKPALINALQAAMAIVQSDPVPGDTSAPAPEPGPAQSPAPPLDYLHDKMMLQFLSAPKIGTKHDAQEFLKYLSNKLKLHERSFAEPNLSPAQRGLKLQEISIQTVREILGGVDVASASIIKPTTIDEKTLKKYAEDLDEKLRQAKHVFRGGTLPIPSKNGTLNPSAPGAPSLPPQSQTPTAGAATACPPGLGGTSIPGGNYIRAPEPLASLGGIPNLGPNPPVDYNIARKPRNRGHSTGGGRATLPSHQSAGHGKAGKIPMKFSNISDFPVAFGLPILRIRPGNAVAASHGVQNTAGNYLKRALGGEVRLGEGTSLGGGPYQSKLFTPSVGVVHPGSGRGFRTAIRAKMAWEYAFNDMQSCPAAVNFRWIAGASGSKTYQWKPNKTFLRKLGYPTKGKGSGRSYSLKQALNFPIGRHGLSHHTGLAADLEAGKNRMTRNRLPPTGMVGDDYKGRVTGDGADYNLWSKEYGINILKKVVETQPTSGRTYGLMYTNIPRCVIKTFKRYGFKWGGDYGGHKYKANTDAMHIEWFGDPRMFEEFAKKYGAPPDIKPDPQNPYGGSDLGKHSLIGGSQGPLPPPPEKGQRTAKR